ncbi:GNAT family N-acetyltransferase [uncultured Alteromonas sp.]|jgi:diamine N-acetyltransferase|uniref:GNAT family N-acetyltransferase n=1 Tax=uncultured Alteromonas sp. TaxID=179113 RepID=UPI0025D265B6|nr:GNAT family N-acetyltransferase [uncultured Alteromonas sp.]
MHITLRDITRHNYEAVCDLDVSEAQQQYVACNMWSLVESHYNEGYTCKAIYREDTPAGFLMWVQESATKIAIWRFMVDAQFQQQGIGRIALQQAIEQIRALPGLATIEICYHPHNPVAREFYSSFGFIETGMDDDGDDMLAEISL